MSRGDRAPRAPPDIAGVVRSAREVSGLSLRAFAARLGVSPASLHAVERGSDPRLSTLRALADRAGLEPRELLGTGRHRAVTWSPARAFELLRRVHGGSARRIARVAVLDAAGGARVVTRVTGLTYPDEDLEDPESLRRVLASVWMSRTPGVSALPVERLRDRGTCEHEEEQAFHRATLSARRGTLELEYTCTERLEPGEPPRVFGEVAAGEPLHELPGCFVLPRLPCERALLGVRFEDGPAPWVLRPTAWPGVIMGTRHECELLGRAGPLPLVRFGRRHAFAVFPAPLPWIALGLCGSDGELEARPRTPESVPVAGMDALAPERALRRARRLAGWSQRELARRAGLSPHTVQAAEGGRELRRSTLRRLLGALPLLRPEHLLAARGSPEPWTAPELWSVLGALFGLESKELRGELTNESPTTWSSRVTSAGFRTLPGRSRDLVLVEHGSRPTPKEAPARLGEIEVGDEELERGYRRRGVHDAGRALELVARVPKEAARRPVTVSQVATGTNPPDKRRRRYGGSLHEPARRFVLVLRPLRGAEPRDVRVVAAPSFEPFGVGDRDVLPRTGLVPRITRDPATGELAVTIARPVLGLRYAITWAT